MNDVPLIVAGLLGLITASIHGIGGELWVVRRLSLDTLPSTRFGGARMTRTMIHVTWHLTTLAFLSVGIALLLSGSVLDGDTARGFALAAAGAATGYGALALGMAIADSPRALRRHPGPIVIASIAVFAWWGAL